MSFFRVSAYRGPSYATDGRLETSGCPEGGLIALQLLGAGLELNASDLVHLRFAERKHRLAQHGVFTHAASAVKRSGKATEEAVPLLRQHWAEAGAVVGRSKPRRVRHIVAAHGCPPETAALLRQVAEHLRNPGCTIPYAGAAQRP